MVVRPVGIDFSGKWSVFFELVKREVIFSVGFLDLDLKLGDSGYKLF